MTCPADQVVIGFGGHAGTILDAISLRCAPLLIQGPPYAIALGASTDTALIGSAGQAFPQTNCLPGQIANVSRFRSSQNVDAFGLRCATPKLLF